MAFQIYTRLGLVLKNDPKIAKEYEKNIKKRWLPVQKPIGKKIFTSILLNRKN